MGITTLLLLIEEKEKMIENSEGEAKNRYILDLDNLEYTLDKLSKGIR